MSGEFGENVQGQHGGGMKVAALLGMLPEDLHHLLICRSFHISLQPFRERNAEGRWQWRIPFQQPLKHPLLIRLVQLGESAFHPAVELYDRHIPKRLPQ